MRFDPHVAMLARVLSGLTMVLSGCPTVAPVSDASPGADVSVPRCTSDAECDDARYCSGTERCMPTEAGADARGCVHEPRCQPSQQCLEADARCVSMCAVAPDADGDGVSAVECGGIDCDDADAETFPTNPEVCDDAEHDEDCDPTTFGVRDADGDGDVDSACCNVHRTTLVRTCGGDCADERRDVRRGLAEVCDGLDNDCDGVVDDGVTRPGAPDVDLDLHGDARATAMTMGCPGARGFSTVTDDCDDTRPAVFGAQLEICDGLDNDCDGATDEVTGLATWYPDRDGDGFGGSDAADVVVSCTPVPGHVTRAGDCDDARSEVHPGADEECNGIDDDCSGRADYVIAPGNTEDDDADGAADRRCGGPDCDDATAATGPTAPELTDGIDNDCNGVVDDTPMSVGWWIDRDGDGYGDATSTPSSSTLPIPNRVTRGGDCDDDDVHVHPGVADPCDGDDDDCDGTLDEDAPLLAFFHDGDDDGWAVDDPTSIVLGCAFVPGVADRVGDCLDSDATRHPDAPELCNAIDDDCDGAIDEEPASLWYVDLDGDGAGGGIGLESCTPIAGRVNRGGDCDDANALRFSGQRETCNGIDDDCDASIDDGASASCASSAPQTIGASCVAGACAPICAGGFSDCDAIATNGCETPTSSDVLRCGGCERRCAPRPHAPATCAAGTCGVACDLGWADCDHDIATGCETQSAADRMNCGACGTTCTASGDACIRGTCLPVPYPSAGTTPLVVTGHTTLAPGIHEYTTITVLAGGLVTTNGIGVLELRASGDVIIEGTIDLSGGRGGDGYSRSLGGGNGQGGPTGDPTPGASGIDGCLVARGGGGGEGGPGSPGSSGCLGGGGRFGGGDGGTGDATSGSSGSGGGGFAGGGGGYVGAVSGGEGGFISGASTGGAGNCGGGPASGPYTGQQCPTTGGIVGGGGGSIGLPAALDLAVATTFRPGSGGGGGQGSSTGASGGAGGGGGGGGGGALRITSLTRIFVSPTGVVRADGGAGGSTYAPSGQGGGGSGGVVFLAAPEMEIRGTVSAVGGLGNLGMGGLGGAGGPGRIRLSVLPERCTLFGTWTPALVSGCAPTRTAPVDGRVYIDVFPF